MTNTTYTATYTLTARDETATAEGFATRGAAQDWLDGSIGYWESMWGKDFGYTAEITAH